MDSIHRRELVRRGLVAAGAAAVGPRLLGAPRTLFLPALQHAAAASVVPPPPVITRAEWGADETIGDHHRTFGRIRKAVVHHTALDDPDPMSQIRGIQRYHVQNQGWSDIGYNFLIDRNGRVYEGRWARDYAPGEVHSGEDLAGNGVIGAHAASHNTGTVGIALLGTYSSDTVTITTAAMRSLARTIAWKFGPRNLDPHGKDPYKRAGDDVTVVFPNICGHRDIVSTGCPGNGLYRRLPELRDHVADQLRGGLVGLRLLGGDGSALAVGATSTFSASEDIGDARRAAGRPVNARGAAGTPSGRGMWVTDAGGGVYALGDAPYFGSTGDRRLNRPVVGMAATPSGRGYWLVASDGGIFSFGDARFRGSTGNIRLVQPIVAMAATPTGAGYWLLARDGGVFVFGDAVFAGSAVGKAGFVGPAGGLAATPSGRGYWVLDGVGAVHAFGDAPAFAAELPAAARPPRALVPIVRA